MDKKIAIVTWYKNLNYGGTLQAYAMQKTLDSMGYDSEFVNFCPEKKDLLYKIMRLLKDIVIFFYKPVIHKSRKKIYKFINDELKVSPPYYKYDELIREAKDRYYAAICGSDQIWCNGAGKVEPLYYLTFIKEDKRISYAPSIGYNNVSHELIDSFKQCINGIRFLSIREDKGAELIKRITGREAQVVLDPSLLLNKQQWQEEVNGVKEIIKNDKYIFCYFLGDDPNYFVYARKLSQLTGFELITLDSKKLSAKGIKKVIADPFDFVLLIKNASYILTDSFHGVAFSINLEKQFAVFKRFKDDDRICQNSRIYNLLNKTNLEDRLISIDTSLTFFENNKINYDMVRPLLELERKSSLDFLSNSIESVINEK